jgi:hypothetical protein
MKQNDPHRLMVQSARDFVGRLGPGDAVGVVAFGGQARGLHPLTVLATEEQRAAASAAIDQIRYGDPRTNISAGIERGLYEFKENGRAGAGQVLVFVTDGIMDTGSSAKDAEMREWLRTRLLPEVAQRGIQLFSIALTEQADFPLIQEMAAATRGDYYRALTAQEIAPILDRIRAKIEARRPPAAPRSAAPAIPGAVAGSAPGIAIAWYWIAGAAGLAILLAGGVIMVRRTRQAAAPAGREAPAPRQAPVPTATPEGRMPAAHLRDMRARKTISLTKPLTRIGRQPDNDVVISERAVSGHHAEIEWRHGQFYLRDLRSTNGTWLNQVRVEKEMMLRGGDVIRFDQFAYTFSGPDLVGEGTMLRDVSDKTLLSGAPLPVSGPAPPRPGPSSLTETAVVDPDSTVDDSVGGPARCPAHSNFEATERCEGCGHLWCALCVPPPPAARLCRRCRETGQRPTKRPASRPGGSASP